MSELALVRQRPLPLAALALGVLVLSILGVAASAGLHMSLLLLLGGAFGLVLYHAAFGFTSAWRHFIVDRRGRGLRAQMLMLAVAVVLFFPALAHGTLFGSPVHGLVQPVGVAVVFGACIFGLGMQLGGGYSSGTLFTVGGGNARMLITLLFFIVGSVIGSAHFAWWTSLPMAMPVSFVTELGPGLAIAINLLAFAAIAGFTILLEKRRHGQLETQPAVAGQRSRWLRGPWPLLYGAVALALLNFVTLAMVGRPWGI